MVMEDFMYYKSGVYFLTQGKSLGGTRFSSSGTTTTAVFHRQEQLGPDVGEGGFFRIAYSEMSNAVSSATAPSSTLKAGRSASRRPPWL